jgi:hypothetical protein
MKIGFYIFILLVIAIVVGFFLTGNVPGFTPADEPDDGSDSAGDQVSTFEDLAPHFRDEMIASGVSRMGPPIHGFNAFLLLGAFPGLLEEDFQGVESFEGMYEFTGSELLHVRTKDQPITSAEDTVSDKGYATLLERLSFRLGMAVDSKKEVEDLVAALLEVELQLTTCTDEEREVDACIQIYQPVCAEVFVQCIKAPCDPIFQTFSNACDACRNRLVEAHTAGECPSQ